MASVRPGGISSRPSKNAPIWAGEWLYSVGQIPLQGDNVRAGQQRAGVRDHHRVPVDVGHPAVRVSGLGELVGVLRGGQPAADVDELPDALPGQPGDGAGQEQPVLPGPHRQQREHAYQA